MVRILTNINLLIPLGLSIFDFISLSKFKNIKIIHKVGQTQHCKLVFSLFTRHNFKYGTKKLHIGPTRHETQISNRTCHELNFMLSSYPCIAMKSPHLGPLHLCLHFHHLYLLTSHVYLNAHTLIVEACIGIKAS